MKREEGKTYGGFAQVALSREKAFYEVRGDDHRPLLVLRECDKCEGSDHALLSRKLDNEKTVLMTQWFRCIKLPNDVLNASHPFRNLFTEEHPPHLFLCRWDGSEVVGLDGNQSQTQLWKAMGKLLKAEYRIDYRRALKDWAKLLNEFDLIDATKLELEERLEKELLERGPKSSKLKKLRGKLDKLEQRRERALKREKAILALPLKPMAPEEQEAWKVQDGLLGAGK